jgi:hypothetical protein
MKSPIARPTRFSRPHPFKSLRLEDFEVYYDRSSKDTRPPLAPFRNSCTDSRSMTIWINCFNYERSDVWYVEKNRPDEIQRLRPVDGPVSRKHRSQNLREDGGSEKPRSSDHSQWTFGRRSLVLVNVVSVAAQSDKSVQVVTVEGEFVRECIADCNSSALIGHDPSLQY